MTEDGPPTIEKPKINEGPYCPVGDLVGYRCICKDEVSDWDDMVDVNKLVPQARIERSWFYPEETRKMPNGSMMINSPRSENTPSEVCMESDWDADLDQVPDYQSRPCNNCRKPKLLKRHTQPLRRPPQGWPIQTWCPLQFKAQSTFP